MPVGTCPGIQPTTARKTGDSLTVTTAAMHGQLEVCRVLLEAGADPNVPTNPKQPGDPGNWTALDWALQANQPAVADLLRKHGGRESGHRRGGGG